jgi:hypothetical protein
MYSHAVAQSCSGLCYCYTTRSLYQAGQKMVSIYTIFSIYLKYKW